MNGQSVLRGVLRTALFWAVAVGLLACAHLRTSPPAEPQTPEQMQAAVGQLQTQVEVKQSRIEALERQNADLRKQTTAERDRRIVLEIQRQVEDLRGLRARQSLRMSPLTEAVLARVIDREIEEVGPAFQGWELFLKHLGLVPAAMDVEKFMRALLSEQVAGLYDDRTKTLYLSDKFDLSGTMAKTFLSHEICHALQDQHFDLTSSPMRLKTNDDRAMACSAVAEGDGLLLMMDYMREARSLRMLLELPGLMMMNQKQVSGAPRIFYHSLLFPYLQGKEFMDACMAKWGWRGRDRPFRSFPASTEQILHPEKYLGPDVDRPTEIDFGKALGRRLVPSRNFYNNVAGEFGVRTILGDRLPQDEAERAAAGWDGDRLVFGGRLEAEYALAWLSVWDSEDDATEFAEALKRYFRKQRKDLSSDGNGTAPAVFRMSDQHGWIVIEQKGAQVACVHADSRQRADQVMQSLRQIAVRRIP